MKAVEVRGRNVSDKELAAVGAWSGVGHRQNSRPAVAERRIEFVGEIVARTSRTVSFGTTALNHEVRDHTVKQETVVKGLPTLVGGLGAFDQTDEIGNSNLDSGIRTPPHTFDYPIKKKITGKNQL